LISKIHQLSQRTFSKLLKDNNLESFNPSQGRIIFPLMQKDNIPIHELVEKTQLSKSTLSSHLENLENLGVIKKVPSKEDKREIFIVLTRKAHDLKHEYAEVSMNMTKLFYKGFSEEDIDKFEGYLHQCLQNLISYE
jgi:DNA-binding MarR family transcriptional regulator